jgi:hypothetical protein
MGDVLGGELKNNRSVLIFAFDRSNAKMSTSSKAAKPKPIYKAKKES